MGALFAGTLYDKLGLDALKDAAMIIPVSLLHENPKQDGDLGRESRRTGSDSFRKYGSTEKRRAYSCNREHHVGCPSGKGPRPERVGVRSRLSA